MAIFDLPYPYVTDAGQCDANFHFLSTGVFVPLDQATTLTGDVTGHGIGTIVTTVTGLGGHTVASTLPTVNQVLQWTGTQWAPATLPPPGVGTVTSITAGHGLTGGTITTSGTVALSVPVAVADGGTGATTASQALLNLGAASSTNTVLTGITSATTPPINDDSTAIATTHWVREQNYLTSNQQITLSGDATGTGTQAIVVTTTGLQGRHVSNAAPAINQVLEWDGSQWYPGTGIGANYLPLAGGQLTGPLWIWYGVIGTDPGFSNIRAGFTGFRWRMAVQVGDDVSAGIFDYRGIDGNALSIVGAGTFGGNRLVHIYDNLTVNGNVNTSGGVYVNGLGWYNSGAWMHTDSGLETSNQLRSTGNRIVSVGGSAPSVACWNTVDGVAMGMWEASNRLQFGLTDGNGSPTTSLLQLRTDGEVGFNNHIFPLADGSYYCGLTPPAAWLGVESYNFYTATSSAQTKDQITSVAAEKCLAIVERLRPVTFRYSAAHLPADERERIHAGFIAEELLAALEAEQLVCGAVRSDGEHMKLAYNELIAVLWGAVQALAKK